MPLPHWLDDVIASLKRERDRWQHSDGAKAERYHTAAEVLEQVALDGKSHDETKAEIEELKRTPPDAFDATGQTPAPGTNEYTGAHSSFSVDPTDAEHGPVPATDPNDADLAPPPAA